MTRRDRAAEREAALEEIRTWARPMTPAELEERARLRRRFAAAQAEDFLDTIRKDAIGSGGSSGSGSHE